MAEIKQFTHIVIKTEDFEKYLNDTEQFIFSLLDQKISDGRCEDNKKTNDYYICNTDEPYADKVLKIILKGEDKKRKCRHCKPTNSID
jgi:hypothetical protein